MELNRTPSDIPPSRRGKPRRKYPFNEMEVGDSLSFDDTAIFEKARRAAQTFTKRYEVLFTTRKGYQDGKYIGDGGTIWRVE